MKVFLSCDLEGVTGSTSWESTNLGDFEYAAVARQMKAEAMAAAEGAIDAGADEVYIKDAHDTGRNIDITGFPKQCRFIRSWTMGPESMLGGIDHTFDAICYIGYHSPAGFAGSPLSHTMNRENNYVKFNGEICSEFLMHAYFASELGIPSVFVSGDKALCNHVHSYDPHIRTVAVKEGIGKATISITPEEACELIRTQVKEAVLHRDECHIAVPESITMEICFKEHVNALRGSYYPGVTQIDPHRISYTANSAYEICVARMFLM